MRPSRFALREALQKQNSPKVEQPLAGRKVVRDADRGQRRCVRGRILRSALYCRAVSPLSSFAGIVTARGWHFAARKKSPPCACNSRRKSNRSSTGGQAHRQTKRSPGSADPMSACRCLRGIPWQNRPRRSNTRLSAGVGAIRADAEGAKKDRED